MRRLSFAFLLLAAGCPGTSPPPSNPVGCAASIVALVGSLGAVAPSVQIGLSDASAQQKAIEEIAASTQATAAIGAAAFGVAVACRASNASADGGK
jgi:hypothetical protein